MKSLTFTLLFALIGALSFGQTKWINGTVTDQQGKPVMYAFVHDVRHPYATYSDTLGNYSLQVDPSSKLAVSALGYQEVNLDINNQTAINVTLKGGGAQAPSSVSSSIFNTHVNASSTLIGSIRSETTAVEGTRYISETWLHGFGVSTKDSLIEDPNLLYNYDKMGGDMLYTDAQSQRLMRAERALVKSFKLYSGQGEQFSFAFVPEIDKTHYVQVLADGSKYKICKQISTKFEKANFVTNGINSQGHKDDEYQDTFTYYVIKAGAAPVVLSLRKKSLKDGFQGDQAKVTKFLADNEGDIDDNYLKALGDSLNQ